MENEPTTKTPIQTAPGFRNFALCTLIFAFSTYLSCHEFIATEPPSLSMHYFSAFSVAISFVPPWLCGYESIMQNKANFKMGKITISTANTKAYANKQRTMNTKRYPKQTQSNPIPPPPNLSILHRPPFTFSVHYGSFIYSYSLVSASRRNWRILSRVSPNFLPISLSVIGRVSPMP